MEENNVEGTTSEDIKIEDSILSSIKNVKRINGVNLIIIYSIFFNIIWFPSPITILSVY